MIGTFEKPKKVLEMKFLFHELSYKIGKLQFNATMYYLV